MGFKLIVVLASFCLIQNLDAKAFSPFWGANPFFPMGGPLLDPEIQSQVMEVQLRLNQAGSISKASIGMNIGTTSKSIGLHTSLAKNNIKPIVNGLQNNPTISKECSSLSKDTVNQLNTDAKNQLSFCSKSSQIQLKSLTSVQKDVSFQVSTLSTELTLGVNQCKLLNPVTTPDSTALNDCITLKIEEVREKLTALEQLIMDAVEEVNDNVNHINDDALLCVQGIQTFVQDQATLIQNQLNSCQSTLIAQQPLV